MTWWVTPRKVEAGQYFNGRSDAGAAPGIWLVAMSAAITWIFAKSIANASDLSFAFGITGGIGYTIYYLSFVVAGVAIYLLRTRGGQAQQSSSGDSYIRLRSTIARSTSVWLTRKTCSCPLPTTTLLSPLRI